MTSLKQSVPKQEPKPFHFEALGTNWWIAADVNSRTLERCKKKALKFQADYSRFDPASLLTQLNTKKRLLNPPSELREMISLSMEISKLTGGLFNLTAGSTLSGKGYGNLNQGERIENWAELITISADVITMSSRVTLDLGGVGKGWLVDSLYEDLVACEATTILINGGGDIRLRNPESYMIPLMMPGVSDQYFAEARFSSGALASSSPLIRKWKTHNHLVNSKGGSYKGEITQLSIYAETAAKADVAATTCILSENSFALAKKLQVEILVTKSDGTYSASPDFPLLLN